MWLRLMFPWGRTISCYWGGRQEVSLKAQCPERRVEEFEGASNHLVEPILNAGTTSAPLSFVRLSCPSPQFGDDAKVMNPKPEVSLWG